MANATQETLLDVLAAIGNIVNAVASLVGVKGTNTTAISSPSNPLDVRLSDGAAATPGATAALQTSVGTTAHNDSAALLAAMQATGPFTALEAISYGGGDQTPAHVNRGLSIYQAGDLYVDMSGVTNGLIVVGVGVEPYAGITKIYQTGSTALGYLGR